MRISGWPVYFVHNANYASLFGINYLSMFLLLNFLCYLYLF